MFDSRISDNNSLVICLRSSEGFSPMSKHMVFPYICYKYKYLFGRNVIYYAANVNDHTVPSVRFWDIGHTYSESDKFIKVRLL